MDKIWDRNPSKSEVIGRCGGDEKNKNINELNFNEIMSQINEK